MDHIYNNEEIDQEPECSNEDGHDWQSPFSIVGGIKENPGVWSLGGTKMSFHKVCSNCGMHRREMHYGSQRNPGEEDTATYEDADEITLAWINDK